MKDFAGKVAVITGAGSGFGLEFARLGAREGMRLFLADVQQDALDAAVADARSRGAEAVGVRADVSKAEDVDRAAAQAKSAFGAVHLLFNNAGVAGGGGYLWESRLKDWKWILGVNLMGVVHGIRSFVPLMLAHGGEGHVVNTASAAGLVSSPLMGAYNASKHAVVTLSETLHHELRLANARIGVSVADDGPPTSSQIAARQRSDKAVASGKLGAPDVARITFEAIREGRFYVITHRKLLATVELRFRDILEQRTPSDPYTYRPDLKQEI